MHSTSDVDTETCHKYIITCYSLLQKIVQSRYNQLNVAIGVQLYIFKYITTRNCTKDTKNTPKQVMELVNQNKIFYAIGKILCYFMILCRVRSMKVNSSFLNQTVFSYSAFMLIFNLYLFEMQLFNTRVIVLTEA